MFPIGNDDLTTHKAGRGLWRCLRGTGGELQWRHPGTPLGEENGGGSPQEDQGPCFLNPGGATGAKWEKVARADLTT